MHALIKFIPVLGIMLASTAVAQTPPAASSPSPPSSASVPTIVWSAVPVPSAVSGEPNPGAAISPMRKNQRAPFTGVLLSPFAIATVITMYSTLPDTIEMERSIAIALCQAKNDHVIADNKASYDTKSSVQSAELKRIATENEKLRKTVDDLEKKQSTQWNSYAWVGLGAIAGVGLTLSVVYLTGRATR